MPKKIEIKQPTIVEKNPGPLGKESPGDTQITIEHPESALQQLKRYLRSLHK